MAVSVDCLVDARARIGESPVWDQDAHCVWWVDIDGQTLHRTDPGRATDQTWSFSEPLGCLALRSAGGLVLALGHDFRGFDPATGALEVLAEGERGRPQNRFNDGTTDSRGRFWAGTMNRGGPGTEPEGRLYRLDPDHSVTAGGTDFFIPNGLAFSADGRTMYWSDSVPHIRTIWAADYDADAGIAGKPRLFFDTRAVVGRPDGGCVDADGCYWMAGVSGWQLVRLTPDGRVDRIIDMPVERPSKVAFGGRELKTMFVTSIGQGLAPGSETKQPQAGGLFVLDLGIAGLPAVPYAG